MLLEVLVMALTKYKLGDLIEQTTELNNGRYTAIDVRGMTITKEIIPTKADVEETDLSRFLVIQPGEFVYNPRTHGKKIGLGYNDTNSAFIISWNNTGFRVKLEARSLVIPEYLFFHFNRSEWDRSACFRSWGSSTEVFSWNALCEMEVILPALPTQQKFVNVYNAMVENQKSYENGLSDLKLTCDAYMDKLKEQADNVQVGALLKECEQRNADETYDDVRGINIEKRFIPSVASLNGVNLAKYKVVCPGQFAYSSMQTGRDKCIRIALLQEDKPVVVSPAYSVLEVIDNRVVLPEYIMLWFSRSESDRYGWFASDGSIRSSLDLPAFYETMMPLPDISIQKSIVDLYIVYLKRKEINERLKSQIKTLCPILIRGSLVEVE